MNRVKYNCHYISDSCIVIYTVVSDFSWHSFSGCPTDITQKKLCKEIGVGENDWIYEEGEEKKVELFLKWNIQLMSCWSKREDLTQSD